MFWAKLKKLLSGVLQREGKSSGNQIWCIVANVVNEHPIGESREMMRGTKHFSPGTKVYCYPPLWGDGYEKIKVIGHHRGSHKLVTMIMPSKWLENWRVKMVYSPQIVERMREYWDGSQESEAVALRIVEALKGRLEK